MRNLTATSRLSLQVAALSFFLLLGGCAKQVNLEASDAGFRIRQGVSLEVPDSLVGLRWKWQHQPAIVQEQYGKKSLLFSGSQRGDGFSASFDATPLRGKWLSITVEFSASGRGWVGPRYFLTKNDGTQFSDPVLAFPTCTNPAPKWVRCTAFAYVPSDAAMVTADVIGFTTPFSVSGFTIGLVDQQSLIKPKEEDALAYQKALGIIKGKFFKASQVHWDALETSVAPWLTSPSGRGWISALAWLVSELPSDGHTSFRANTPRSTNSIGDSKSYNAVVRLNEKTGYLKLGATSSGETPNDYADQALLNVDSLAKQGVTSWIVDLRGNYGGNMYPMLEVLAPIIGTGNFGYFEYNDGRRSQFGLSNEGAFVTEHDDFDKKIVLAKFPPSYSVRKASNDVYVLIDSKCASACEAVAVALRVLPNVHLFGQPTRGLATGNATYPIGDKYLLVLTESYLLDGRGVRVYPRVEPEKPLQGNESGWVEDVRQIMSSPDNSQSSTSIR